MIDATDAELAQEPISQNDESESQSAAESSKRAYKALRMCVNFRAGNALPSCGARGAKDVLEIMEREWEKRDLPYKFEPVHCLGKCHCGPTMRLVPAGPFIMGAKDEKDVSRILDLLEAGEADKAAEEFPLPDPDARPVSR